MGSRPSRANPVASRYAALSALQEILRQVNRIRARAGKPPIPMSKAKDFDYTSEPGLPPTKQAQAARAQASLQSQSRGSVKVSDKPLFPDPNQLREEQGKFYSNAVGGPLFPMDRLQEIMEDLKAQHGTDYRMGLEGQHYLDTESIRRGMPVAAMYDSEPDNKIFYFSEEPRVLHVEEELMHFEDHRLDNFKTYSTLEKLEHEFDVQRRMPRWAIEQNMPAEEVVHFHKMALNYAGNR